MNVKKIEEKFINYFNFIFKKKKYIQMEEFAYQFCIHQEMIQLVTSQAQNVGVQYSQLKKY